MSYFRNRPQYRSARGQVLLLGVAVLIILLIAALLLFDLHNAVRAKIKVESAQQAAALAGAQWQVAGLNMIGELNIAKACTLMLEEQSVLEATPYVPTAENSRLTAEELEKLKMKHRLDSRLRTLNEAQSRVSFILPMLGYAAVQQTAKQNGLLSGDGGLKNYLENTLPRHDHKERDIQGYFWYDPYLNLVRDIYQQRPAVRCNARIAELPEVWSNPKGSRKIKGGGETGFALLLSEESLYDAIANENFCHWQLRKMAKAGVYLDAPWWKITYIPGQFIEESELLPLGVRYGGGVSIPDLLQNGILQDFNGPSEWNTDASMQPDVWCLYDSKWYGTSWTEEAYNSQQYNWRGGRWLRNDRLAGFMYEGAVTAVDGGKTMGRVMTFHTNPQNGSSASSEEESEASSSIIALREPLRKKSLEHVYIGGAPSSRGVNRGVVAKVLGGFHDLRSPEDAPIVTPLILPVFSRGLLVPSSMPYSVVMLSAGDDALKRFLQWLATWPDIDRSRPPDGTEWYLTQLRKLMDPDFILSIYNSDFPGLDTLDFKELLSDDYFYPNRSDGAGWLQQAHRVRIRRCPQKVVYTGKKVKCGSCDKCRFQSQWVKGASTANCGSWEITYEPAVEDDVPIELPQTYVDEKGVTRRYFNDYANSTRVYYGNKDDGYFYCVKRNGKFQTNEDISCEGHLWTPSGGNMSLGIESGPSRL